MVLPAYYWTQGTEIFNGESGAVVTTTFGQNWMAVGGGQSRDEMAAEPPPTCG
jgi:hypothetical protein